MYEEPKVAIAHDYLTQKGGAEKVVLALARAFPSAPIYTTLYEGSTTYPEFREKDIRTSWLNRIPALRKDHRLALPLLATAVNSTKIRAAHTIVSSSGWAHGYRTSGAKIVYCHSPARWLYQPGPYLGRNRFSAQGVALAALSGFLRRWDKRQANSATRYFAVSSVVQQRILDTYGIDAEVLPAPHSIDPTLPLQKVNLTGLSSSEGFYLCISRLLPYKNVDVIVDAFNKLQLPLVIVGAGPEENRLAKAAGATIVMLKDLTDAEVRWLYANCKALVAASYEDFGLTPIEAATFGKPSIALRWGGFLDTICEGATGIYFDEPHPDLICQSVEISRATEWNEEVIKAQAANFTEERFAKRLKEALAATSS